MKKLICLLLAVFSVCSCLGCSGGYASKTKQFNNGNVKMIAHRGLSGMEVENTISAFEEAGKRSYYGIEADLLKSSDGKFIVCHDDNLERLSGKQLIVNQTPMAVLMNLAIYDKYGKTNPGERLTDLYGYLSVCKQYQKQAILELKASFSKEEIAKIIEQINQLDYINSVTFISFNYNNLLYVRELLPNQNVQLLFSEVTEEIIQKVTKAKMDVGVNHKALSKEIIKRFHDANLQVGCWTVDKKLRAKKLISWGVDYITTNILE